MKKGENITLVYNKFCPFAQRALITALEKELPVNFIKVSLGEKSDFFSETYKKAYGRDPKSNGKVPILIHQHRILAQSEIVCWYLAETFQSGSSLIPKDTFQKSKMRAIINQQCSNLIQVFNKPKMNLVKTIELYREELRQALNQIEKSIQGDYFLGNEISLVDIMIYPWFQRWVIIEHYFEVKITDQYKKIKTWLKHMLERKSIIETKKLTNNQYYISRSEKMMTSKL